MSYRVTVFAEYSRKPFGPDITQVSFDTESVMIQDVAMDAACELLTHRMHNGRDYTETPVMQTLSAYPTLSLRK